MIDNLDAPAAARPFLAGVPAAMSCREMAVLVTIHERPGLAVRHIARALTMSKPAVSRAMDSLVEAGLARRVLNLQDRRETLLHTTFRGEALLRLAGVLQGARAA